MSDFYDFKIQNEFLSSKRRGVATAGEEKKPTIPTSDNAPQYPTAPRSALDTTVMTCLEAWSNTKLTNTQRWSAATAMAIKTEVASAVVPYETNPKYSYVADKIRQVGTRLTTSINKATTDSDVIDARVLQGKRDLGLSNPQNQEMAKMANGLTVMITKYEDEIAAWERIEKDVSGQTPQPSSRVGTVAMDSQTMVHDEAMAVKADTAIMARLDHAQEQLTMTIKDLDARITSAQADMTRVTSETNTLVRTFRKRNLGPLEGDRVKVLIGKLSKTQE